MESSAGRRRAPDAEQSAQSCSVTVKCEPVAVKEEPEWGASGVSEAAAAEGLYAGHEVKDELVFGPEKLQQQDIAFSIKRVLCKAEEDACKLQPAGEAGPATERARAQSGLAARGHTHTGQKPHSCDVCHKRFAYLGHFRRHLKLLHTGNKSFSCDTCNKQFTQKRALTVHIRIHKGEKPTSCDTCNKQFAQKSSLAAHIRIHTGEKPFSCDTCNIQFTQKGALAAHIRIHTGEKPFSCDTCNRQFAQKSALATHIRIHTGEKPFSCDTCNIQFTHKSALAAHLRIHTGEKPNSRDIC